MRGTDAAEAFDGSYESAKREREKREQHEADGVLAVQCVLLGYLLGNKDARKDFDPRIFAGGTFRQAVRELDKGGPYTALARLLESFGIKWCQDDGPPLRALFERAKIDAQHEAVVWEVWNAIGRDLDNVQHPKDVRRKLKAVATLTETASKVAEIQGIEWKGTDAD